MNEKTYYVRIKDEEIQLKIDTQENITQFLKKIITDFFNGDLVPSNEENLDREIKKQKLRKLTAEATIKEREAKYIENFDSIPSPQAKEAIRTNVSKQFRELTDAELDNFAKVISLQNSYDGFQVTCLKCRNKFERKDRLEAIHEAIRHLSAVHGAQILQ